MARIETLLLAIDINSDSSFLIERVAKLYEDVCENVHVVHVISRGMHDIPCLNARSGRDAQVRRVTDHALRELKALLNKHELDIADERLHLVYGEPSCEIKRLASQLHADLVIVGSRTRENDWLQLPGATTNCVIQGINSDVMAVKVAEPKETQRDETHSARTAARLEIR